MFDFAAARRMMVDGQVRHQRRHRPAHHRGDAGAATRAFRAGAQCCVGLSRLDVAVTEGAAPPRRLLKPMVLAKLIQAADIGPAGSRSRCRLRHRLLDRVAGAAGGAASSPWRKTGCWPGRRGKIWPAWRANAEVVTGVLPDGWQARAPYNVIFLNGAVDRCRNRCFASWHRAAGWSRSSDGHPRPRRCGILLPGKGGPARCRSSTPRRRRCRDLRSRQYSYSDVL